jgi:hypothetical protein
MELPAGYSEREQATRQSQHAHFQATTVPARLTSPLQLSVTVLSCLHSVGGSGADILAEA